MTPKEAARNLIRWALLPASEQKAAVRAACNGMRYRSPTTGDLLVAPHNDELCPDCRAETAQRKMSVAGIVGRFQFRP